MELRAWNRVVVTGLSLFVSMAAVPPIFAQANYSDSETSFQQALLALYKAQTALSSSMDELKVNTYRRIALDQTALAIEYAKDAITSDPEALVAQAQPSSLPTRKESRLFEAQEYLEAARNNLEHPMAGGEAVINIYRSSALAATVQALKNIQLAIATKNSTLGQQQSSIGESTSSPGFPPLHQNLNVSHSYVPPLVLQLLTTGQCEGCDLRNSQLGGARLIRANLQAADLTQAELEGVDLAAANLKAANLSHANLGNATLTGASLIGANLSNADLHRANLAGADLSHVKLAGADLHGANLAGANLAGVDLTQADLCSATMPNGKVYQKPFLVFFKRGC